MELQELYDLMARFSASGLSELEWKKQGEEIVLRRAVPAAPAGQADPAPAVSAPAAPAQPAGELVKAPLVGVVYAAPAPGEEPFAAPGRRMKKGETLCLMEAMKMMSEVPAPADCVVEEMLVQDGEAVGFGQALFRIRKV